MVKGFEKYFVQIEAQTNNINVETVIKKSKIDDKKVEIQQSSKNDSKDVENLEEDFTNSDSDEISNEREPKNDTTNDDDDDEFIIEKVLDKHVDSNGKVKYFVKWEAFGDEENTWESAENVEKEKAIVEYEKNVNNKIDEIEHFGHEKISKIENNLLILNKARPDIVPLLKNENEKILTSNQDGTFTCVTCGEILDNLTIAKAHHGECIGGIDENEMPRLEKQIFNSETFHENLEKKNSAKEIKESKISLVGNNKSDDKTKRNRSTMKQQSETVKEQVSVKKVEKNSELEQNNVEYKTYFHCINCNTDVFKNTEAFVHLGKLFVYVNWETNILYCKV